MARKKKHTAKSMVKDGMTLTGEQKLFIWNRVRALRTVKRVESVYNRDDLVGMCAREYAKYLKGE